jgi:hypothetical protein
MQSNRLASLLERTETKSKSNELMRKRANNWVYYFQFDVQKIKVRLKFIINLYQISRQRIDTIKHKLIKGSLISDNRGLNTKTHTIHSSVWDSLNHFLTLIPSNFSHYKSTDSNKRYFENQEFNPTKLSIIY